MIKINEAERIYYNNIYDVCDILCVFEKMNYPSSTDSMCKFMVMNVYDDISRVYTFYNYIIKIEEELEKLSEILCSKNTNDIKEL